MHYVSTAPDSGPVAADTSPPSRAVAFWLLLCAAMILVMVVLGGVTRLTHSGLSMVEWQPIAGILPPTSDAAWVDMFEKYQQFPEFKKLNHGMTLDGFKNIFWLEYLHRLWGRTIGMAFLLPLIVFGVRRQIPARLIPKLIGVFVLGGLQGAMGWYMVKSGLIDRPDVSHYRLTAHLGLAFLIYGYIVWTALSLLNPHPAGDKSGHAFRLGILLLVLLCLTVLLGGLVAGLDAGFAYNTFPLMAGQWIPDNIMSLTPWLSNFFENPTTVQFCHRLVATLTLIGVCGYAGWLRTQPVAAHAQRAGLWLIAVVLTQFCLGVATLLYVVPVPLAAAHQAGALVLFTTLLWVIHSVRPARH